MSTGSILFSFLLWAAAPQSGAEPALLARAVLNGAGVACPTVQQNGSSAPMTARVNPSATHFPVTVCEAVVTPGATVTLATATGSATLPPASKAPQTLAVLGDTGCRDNPAKQPCTDTAWPFQAIAGKAASANPDLIIHVGDYNYRGTPSKTVINGQKQTLYNGCQLPSYQSQNVPGSETPDGWAAWLADFFTPSEPALTAAPWVMLRGNHELCAKAGPGWFYFLDPASALVDKGYVQNTCTASYQDTLDASPPYALAFDTLRLVVMDTAAACDDAADPVGTPGYSAQMKAVQALAGSGPAWLLTHRPVWGVTKVPDADGKNGEILNPTLQAALANAGGTLPANVGLILSGHIHRFESVAFAGKTGRPPQLVIGDSGVQLSGSGKPATAKVTIGGATAHITQETKNFGYMIAKLGKGGSWSGTVYDPHGDKKHALASCAVPFDKAKDFCSLGD
ncbi:metallophosphoesterase family protein [Azospirillum sp.]|uniref:metallophosphoesterase family protein n=1 Tax=Azospirillum sp. TaxID=34012 RepID=UPI002D6BA73B|nr:metallophosphoesterase [Azospirillum sp.]HYD69609.1 metallophosphoesterase [Azospirillum sp.]